MYYLAGVTIIIQRPMTIFSSVKEYLRTNQRLARVNLNDISSLIKSCHVLFKIKALWLFNENANCHIFLS